MTLHSILKKIDSDLKISKKVHFKDLENNKENIKKNNNLFLSGLILFGVGIVSIIIILK